MIDELCHTRHFRTAYLCAKEEKDIKEQFLLLEVVASGLTLNERYESANLVKEKILDEGRKKDLEEMLNRYL